ncbi:uncharacterized protein LOC128991129 [Macrosteles quadrilineatus]|uniref:uncharacterized protein LOC128991129 n=1 Tax=Macrosteles quadrilineatus TaxID=74068 RepID=UPI0023E2A820|nr:uncharacterized protein LOC128991129 [Macrosteles quadrilineatus]
MGINTKKARLRLVVAAVLCVVPWCSASLCPPGLQYWSNEFELCINCSRCDASAKQVVLRPCQAHADTLCGPISHLDIDWSWLKHKHPGKHHEKHPDDEKHHGKGHKHHSTLDDDIVEKTPLHHSILDDEVETLPPVTHHGNHKHHKHSKLFDDEHFEKKHSRNHHLSSESFLSDDLEPIVGLRKISKLPPPPPLKSTDELEKEWQEWLRQSKNRLQHRKDDLLKTLHKENSEKHHKLNHPSENSHSRTMKTPFDDFDGEIFHSHHKDHSQKKHFSPLDLEIFDRLLNHDLQKQEERLTLSHLLNPENKHASLLDIMKSEDKQREEKDRPFAGNDLGYPMDTFDFRSVVPTHRLFLGEPSTVSEIMDQDFSEESEDNEDERLKEDKDQWLAAGDPSVIAVPFSATERFVWDWQAVALTSAVAACLLFFVVVACYSILHARHWRRLKTNFDTDAEELSVKMGLMQSQSVASSAADGINTNIYLENLLENQKKKSGNIYTQKRPQS